jgi:hypothetical protein
MIDDIIYPNDNTSLKAVITALVDERRISKNKREAASVPQSAPP